DPEGGGLSPLFLLRHEDEVLIPVRELGGEKGGIFFHFSERGGNAEIFNFLLIYKWLPVSLQRGTEIAKISIKPAANFKPGCPDMKKIYSKILLIALIVSTIIFSGIHVTFGVN
ncbi:MAG: hypothetical protein H6Q42_3604, partial [Deltaproteobacteria bacterium]|nr:hypothetical protein [Deltaproteobacteria bacterium]